MSLVIGLTGGIASGKSTIVKMLEKRNIYIIDADVEARLAVERGQPAYNQIIETFGTEILKADQSIDREKLGKKIFSDEVSRQRLNEIVHPAVRKQMMGKRFDAEKLGERLIIMDIPLLFESKLTEIVDKTLLVYVDEPIQIERLMKRNQLSYDDALLRIRAQLPLTDKRNLADEIIDNNGSIENSEAQLLAILNKWGFNFD